MNKLSPAEIKIQLEMADNIMNYIRKGKGFQKMDPRELHKILEKEYSQFRHAHGLVFDMMCMKEYDKKLFTEYLHSDDVDRDIVYVVTFKRFQKRLSNSQCRKLKRDLKAEKDKHKKEVGDILDYQRKLNIYREEKAREDEEKAISSTDTSIAEKTIPKEYTDTHSFLLERLNKLKASS